MTRTMALILLGWSLAYLAVAVATSVVDGAWLPRAALLGMDAGLLTSVLAALIDRSEP